MPPDNVLVFDGACTLCSSSVPFIIKRDKQAVFRFATLQSPVGARLLKQHGIDPHDVRTLLLLKGGTAYQRSDAVIEIAEQLGGPWKLARALALVPKPVRDRLYDLVAQNRHRWFGTRKTCPVAPDDIRSRFLE